MSRQAKGSQAVSKASALRRRCPACAELIRSEAKRCRYCDTALTWREHLTLSNTILAFAVALVTVATAAIPVIYNLTRTKNSNLEAQIYGPDGPHLNWIVSNSGSRPGSVGSATFDLEVADRSTGLDTGWMIPRPPSIVEPEKTALVSQTLEPSLLTNIWGAIESAERNSPGHYVILNQCERLGWIRVKVHLPLRDFGGRIENADWAGFLLCSQDGCSFDDTHPMINPHAGRSKMPATELRRSRRAC